MKIGVFFGHTNLPENVIDVIVNGHHDCAVDKESDRVLESSQLSSYVRTTREWLEHMTVRMHDFRRLNALFRRAVPSIWLEQKTRGCPIGELIRFKDSEE